MLLLILFGIAIDSCVAQGTLNRRKFLHKENLFFFRNVRRIFKVFFSVII